MFERRVRFRQHTNDLGVETQTETTQTQQTEEALVGLVEQQKKKRILEAAIEKEVQFEESETNAEEREGYDAGECEELHRQIPVRH